MRHSRRFVSGARRALSFLAVFLWLLSINPALSQDIGGQDKEYLGNGSVITVLVHHVSGAPFASPAVVKLFRGITPSGQRDTTRGVAEFVVNRFGEFTVVVSAPGYAEAQKDVSVDIAGRTQVDMYLRCGIHVGSR